MGKQWSKWILLALTEGLYLLLYSDIAPRIILFVIVSLATSALYALVWWFLAKSKNLLPGSAIIIVGVIFRLTLLWLPPTASNDLYRYVWDGKVLASGINPYSYPPNSPKLAPLRSGALPDSVNFPGMRTLYPPAAELFFRLSYGLAGENLTLFKLPLLVAECLTMVLLLLLLKELKLPGYLLALYAFCPLPVMHFMVDGHVDGAAFPFLLGFLLLWLRGRKFSASAALGLSIATKLLPVIFVGKMRWKGALVALLIGLLSYVPFCLDGTFSLESLQKFSLNWVANGPLFRLLYAAMRNNPAAHVVSGFLIAGWLIYCSLRYKNAIDAMCSSLVGFFLLSPVVHPWYLTWLAVLLPLRFRWSSLLFVVLVNLAGITLIGYRLNGVWGESLPIQALEYAPVAAALLVESKFFVIASPARSRMMRDDPSFPPSSSSIPGKNDPHP